MKTGFMRLLLGLCVMVVVGGVGVSTASAVAASGDTCRQHFYICAYHAEQALYACDPSWGFLRWDYDNCLDEYDRNLRAGMDPKDARARLNRCIERAWEAFERHYKEHCWRTFVTSMIACANSYTECRNPGGPIF